MGARPKRGDQEQSRIEAGLQAGDPTWVVTVAWHGYQRLRAVFHITNLHEAKKVAVTALDSFHTCPVPEIARLGRTRRTTRARRPPALAPLRGRTGNRVPPAHSMKTGNDDGFLA